MKTMMRVIKTLGTLGCLLLTACGGTPDTQQNVASVGDEAFDVDVAGQKGRLYARVDLHGHTAYAVQLPSGAWREGEARVMDRAGVAVKVDAELVDRLGRTLYDRLTKTGRLEAEPVPLAHFVEQEDEGFDASTLNPFIVVGAEPHKPVDAEPHRDGAEPHSEDDAEPHTKPEAEPHAPVVAAEPH